MKNLYKYIPLFVYFTTSVGLLLLSNQNWQRSLVIFILITFWFLFGSYKKNFLLSSTLLLILSFPLNITINIEGLFDPYVGNIISNYLILHVSILDLVSSIVIFSGYYERKTLSIPRNVYLLFFLLLFSILLNFSLIGVVWLIRLTFYILALKYIWDNQSDLDIKWLFITVLFSTITQVLIAFLQFYKGSMLGLSFLGESSLFSGSIGSSFLSLGGRLVLRGYGTFPHPNVLAGFLLLSLVLSFAFYKKIGKLTYLLSLVPIFGLFLTFSRLHIFLGLFLAFLFFIQNIKNFTFSFIVLERFLNILTGGDLSISERYHLLLAAMKMILENPFGVGWGLFVKNLDGIAPRTAGGIYLLQPVHNIFVLNIAEHGIFLGILLNLLIVITWFKNNIRYFGKVLGFGIFLSLLSIGFLDHYLLTLPQGLFLFVLSIL